MSTMYTTTQFAGALYDALSPVTRIHHHLAIFNGCWTIKIGVG